MIYTRCTQNCKRVANINEKLGFELTCSGCEEETQYKWICAELKNCDKDPTEADNIQLQFTDAQLDEKLYGKITDIHIVFKERTLEGGKCYYVTITATNPAKRTGRGTNLKHYFILIFFRAQLKTPSLP